MGLRTTKDRAGKLTPLEERNSVLRTIIDSKFVKDSHGQALPLHSNVSALEANALYEFIKKRQPRTVLEVGMAFGVSSLAILTALN